MRFLSSPSCFFAYQFFFQRLVYKNPRCSAVRRCALHFLRNVSNKGDVVGKARASFSPLARRSVLLSVSTSGFCSHHEPPCICYIRMRLQTLPEQHIFPSSTRFSKSFSHLYQKVFLRFLHTHCSRLINEGVSITGSLTTPQVP